jgi:glycosyltransferase involved in cell wall biosynthesis
MAKIAILYEVLGRSRGGIEAWIYHASEELVRQGHEVTIYNTQEDKTPTDAAPEGVSIVSLSRKKISPSVFFLRSVLSYKKQLKSTLLNYDIVWVRSFGMAWAASRILKDKRTVYINAAPYAFYAYRPFKLLLKKSSGISGILQAISSQISYKTAWFFEKSAIPQCTNVFLSKTRKDQTLSFFGIKDNASQYLVIPAGVNNIKFYPSDTMWDGIKPLKLITVCRLERDKNIQCILMAIKILRAENFEVFLTVVGEGNYMEELLKLTKELNIEDSVLFSGRQENIEDWYRNNNIFVLPSLYEGFGSVYIEAMASGLPCIAISNRSGKYSVAADEIIDHNINGFLMRDDNPDELSYFIQEFFRTPKKLHEFGINARTKVLNSFTWEKTILNLLKIQ